jgi:hypothetical protein
LEEPTEEVQDQTTVEAQVAQQEAVAEPVPIAEPQPLRRSTRERKTTISDDYVHMREEGNDMGKVDDPNSFEEATSSEHSHKWIEAMEKELKSMSTNKVWDLVEIPEVAKTEAVNGSTRQNMTPKGKSNGSKQDLWLRASHKENELIILRPSHLSRGKTRLESLWL